METQRLNDQQATLFRIQGTIARFLARGTSPDQRVLREHLVRAYQELEEASKQLIEDKA